MRNRVRTLRHQRRWTLAELSKRSGIPMQTISGLECKRIHNPSYKLVTSLAAAFGVPADELFSAPAEDAGEAA